MSVCINNNAYSSSAWCSDFDWYVREEIIDTVLVQRFKHWDTNVESLNVKGDMFVVRTFNEKDGI